MSIFFSTNGWTDPEYLSQSHTQTKKISYKIQLTGLEIEEELKKKPRLKDRQPITLI